jgi:hypothetical protein
MKLEIRIYGWLLKAYPTSFRLEFETEMLQVFKLQNMQARLEKRLLSFWLSTVFDWISSVAHQRFLRKGESMNWLQKLGAISSFLFGLEILAYIFLKLLHVNLLSSIDFLTLIARETPVLHGFLFSFLGIGIIAALPHQKNRVELFGIGAFSVGWIYSALILPSYLPEDPNVNLTMLAIFSTILLFGILAIIFARVRLARGKLIWSEMPIVSRALIVFCLFNFFLPTVLPQFFMSEPSIYSVLGRSINALGWMSLAFGIWHSKPFQPHSPNAISS